MNDAQTSLNNKILFLILEKPFSKNYHQTGLPQQTYSVGLEYRDPHYWWLGTNVNYITESYISVSPLLEQYFSKSSQRFSFPQTTEAQSQGITAPRKIRPCPSAQSHWWKNVESKGKLLDCLWVLPIFWTPITKPGGYEQARNANFRQRKPKMSPSDLTLATNISKAMAAIALSPYIWIYNQPH